MSEVLAYMAEPFPSHGLTFVDGEFRLSHKEQHSKRARAKFVRLLKS